MFWYFGAKHRLANTYQPPQRQLIIEPFAGSAGYTCYWLEKYPEKSAILFDTDPRVADLWNRILSQTPEQIANWPLLAEGDHTKELWIASLGGSGSVKQELPVVTPWMVRYQPTVRRRIAWLRATIGDRITFIEGDYSIAPDIEATWHIDPPYQYQGQRYEHGSEDIDYQQLSRWCQTRQGQVMVCEQEPAGWLPFQPHSLHRSAQNTHSRELVWYNQFDPTLLDLIQ